MLIDTPGIAKHLGQAWRAPPNEEPETLVDLSGLFTDFLLTFSPLSPAVSLGLLCPCFAFSLEFRGHAVDQPKAGRGRRGNLVRRKGVVKVLFVRDYRGSGCAPCPALISRSLAERITDRRVTSFRLSSMSPSGFHLAMDTLAFANGWSLPTPAAEQHQAKGTNHLGHEFS
ncbi:hypothetical protein [Parapedobacter composti]|uniref:hypothetical protein n=1 Tax=Parapedobacter composti TaxID=623281 RepID=UPI00147DF627|nr:hypothetical protein [Parapedobacter composti]